MGKLTLGANNQCCSYSCAVKTVSSKRLGMGRESHLYLLSFACQQQPAAGRYRSCETTCTWVGPLSSHDTGVYDGLQEAPRYFIVGGEYQGLNLLCVNWVGMRCAEKAVNGLDQ
jgi:hypothetical protein